MVIDTLKIALDGVQAGKALDVGTRFGEFAFRLAEVMPGGSTVIGVDSDPGAEQKAREKMGEKGLQFELMDGRHLQYPDDSFELVALSNTLHHIKDYEDVLKEMLRVLRPGGFFVLNEMYRDCPEAAQQVHEAQHTFEAKLDCLRGGYQRRTWKREEIVEIFQSLPLHDVSFTDFQEDALYDTKLEEKNRKLDQAVEKVAGLSEYGELKREALEIQARCREVGIRRCTQLLCVGRK